MDIEEWETLSTKIPFEECFKEIPGRNLRRTTMESYATRKDQKNHSDQQHLRIKRKAAKAGLVL
jgi:hypothetical protein